MVVWRGGKAKGIWDRVIYMVTSRLQALRDTVLLPTALLFVRRASQLHRMQKAATASSWKERYFLLVSDAAQLLPKTGSSIVNSSFIL
jgi:hypothetical protein